MRRRAPSCVGRQGGQSLVETALVIVVVFGVVFWVFEICQLMYTYSVIADAANEGVRYAVVHSEGDVAGTQARVLQFAQLSMHDVSAMSPASVTFPDGDATPPHRVRVTVSYTYVPYLKVFMTPPSMSAYAEGRMVVE